MISDDSSIDKPDQKNKTEAEQGFESLFALAFDEDRSEPIPAIFTAPGTVKFILIRVFLFFKI